MLVQLQTIRDLVASEADVEITTSGRHQTTTVNQRINAAYRRYLTHVLELAPERLVKRAILTTSAETSGSDQLDPNQYVSLPADFDALRLVEFNVNGRWRKLDPVTDTQADDYERSYYGDNTSRPVSYRVTTLTDGTPALFLQPRAQSAYDLRVTYIPAPVEVASDTGTFDLLPGADEWIAIEVAEALLRKNGIPEGPVYQAMQARKSALQTDWKRWASRLDRSGSGRMLNTRRRRLMNEHLAARYFPE